MIKGVPTHQLGLLHALVMLDTDWAMIREAVMVSYNNTQCFQLYDANITVIVDINECTEGLDDCEQRCSNTPGTFTCSCDSGFTLDVDGRSCIADSVQPVCGGVLTTATGSFQTPGYPVSYPFENFQCEWIIQLPNTGATIEFTIDETAFGIKGKPPCSDPEHNHIEFFDGISDNAVSLNKICGINVVGHWPSGLPTITTTSSEAKVVFTGNDIHRNPSRVGVKVNYKTVSGTTGKQQLK